MRLLAFHRLIRFSGGAASYRVVCVDENGRYAGDFALTEERAGVEWIGGVGLLLPDGYHPQAGKSIADVLVDARAQCAGGGNVWCLWIPAGLPLASGMEEPVRAYRPVGGTPHR